MKLLVAIDFSELAKKIIAEAEKLAKNLKAKVFLLHVIPPPSPIIDVPPDVEALLPPEELFKKESLPPPFDLPESVKLIKIAQLLQESGIDTAVIVAQNDEVTAIIDESKKNGVDLIMLGSHGHGALFHLIIGSVSEGVIRRATCPVIIVPSVKR
ncbi:MAG: universal stress protein [Chlorobiaceae bacterium]|nr:universal stress protein [Chlorobiaceae bacterium]